MIISKQYPLYADRRRQSRFLPKHRIYIVSGSRSGLIINFNLSGLAFDYIPRRLGRIEKAEMNIVCCDEVFCEKLNFKSVYDQEVSHGYDDHTMLIKRCGVYFENPAPTQLQQLEDLLDRLSA